MSSGPSKPKRGKKSGSKHSVKSGIKPGSEIFYNLTHPIVKIRPVCSVKPTPRIIPVATPPAPAAIPIVRETIDIDIEEALALRQVAYAQENHGRPGPSNEHLEQLYDSDSTVDYDSDIVILD